MNKLIFDVETTGVDVNKDRIVQIAWLEIDKDTKERKQFSVLINPGIHIPKEASDVHGITDAKVKNAKTFGQIAKSLKNVFENKILIGYNILTFDLPILITEFERAKVDIKLSKRIIDVYRIQKNIKPQTLSGVYKSFTGKDLDNAHDALSDVLATYEVLRHQAGYIKKSDKSVYELSESKGIIDYGNRVVKNGRGELVYNFGKNKGQSVKEVHKKDRSYAEWILKSDFPNQLKNLIKKEIQ